MVKDWRRVLSYDQEELNVSSWWKKMIAPRIPNNCYPGCDHTYHNHTNSTFNPTTTEVNVDVNFTSPNVKAHDRTVVKYTFNRPLTWSEREELRNWLIDDLDYVDHTVSKNDRRVVTVTFSDTESRWLTDIISAFAETLLNVHPVSAHTIQPRVKV
jgi:hypothetical protein